MLVDYEEIQKKMKDCKECCIIASQEYAYVVEKIYDEMTTFNTNCDIYILSSDNIICPLKHQKLEFSVLLGVECLEHKFDNCVSLKLYLSDEIIEKTKNYKNIIYDSLYNKPNYLCNIQPDEEVLVVSDNLDFYKFWSKKYNCVSICNLTSESKLDYLSKRICVAEKSKKAKTFAIIFVHEIYKPLAIKIRDTLIKLSKYAYILFLKNVHYSRLVTIENVDAIILIDCPMFHNLDIDVSLPILTPTDMSYMFTDIWNDNYDINNFNVPVNSLEEQSVICKYEGAGKYLLKSDFFGIEYDTPEDDDYNIYEGRKGLPEEYENE